MGDLNLEVHRNLSILDSLRSRGWDGWRTERSPIRNHTVGSIRRGDILLEASWDDNAAIAHGEVLMGLLSLVDKEDIQPGRHYAVAPQMGYGHYFDGGPLSVIRVEARISRAVLEIPSNMRSTSIVSASVAIPPPKRNDPVMDVLTQQYGLRNLSQTYTTPIKKGLKTLKGETWLRMRVDEMRWDARAEV